MANEKRLQLPTRLPLARLMRRFQAPGMAFWVVGQGLACLSKREEARGEKLRSEFQESQLRSIMSQLLFYISFHVVEKCILGFPEREARDGIFQSIGICICPHF